MGFGQPWAFALLLLPGLWYVWRSRKGKPAVAFSNIELLQASQVWSLRQRLLWLPAAFDLLWWLFVVAAAAQPQKPVLIPAQMDDLPAILFAIDVSGSMAAKAESLQEITRLDLCKQSITDIIEKRGRGEARVRFGIVAFSEYPRVICPLTTDRDFLMQVLKELRVDILENRTNIGDAIALCLDQLWQMKVSQASIIVCSDGAHNVTEAVTPGLAARMAQALKFPINVIGVASQEGESTLDEQTLQAVAELTGGRYFRAHSLNDIRFVSGTLSESMAEESPRRQLAYQPITAECLAAALACLFLATLLRLTWLRVTPEV